MAATIRYRYAKPTVVSLSISGNGGFVFSMDRIWVYFGTGFDRMILGLVDLSLGLGSADWIFSRLAR